MKQTPMIKTSTLLLSLAFSVAMCAQPENDLCTSVTPEALAIGTSLNFAGTRAGATSTDDGVPGNVLVTTTGVVAVWHAFTTTECCDLTVLYCNNPLPVTAQWNFLTPTCPADIVLLASFVDFGGYCTNGQYGGRYENLPPGTYYLPVRATSSDGSYEVEVSAIACSPGPVNDDCFSATTLAVNTTCVNVIGTVDHATASEIPVVSCNDETGDANDDVWFSFTATGTEHTITVDGSGFMDAVIELYTEDCGGEPLTCADATLDGGVEQIEASGLIPNEVYKVRVFHWYTTLPDSAEFTICVTGEIGIAVPEILAAEVRVLSDPAMDRITLLSAERSMGRILDITGRLQWEGRFVNSTTIDVSTWPRGTYIVSMEFGHQVRTERIVLQ